MNILVRKKRLHLNDPRCYNGCYFDAEYVWGDWEVLEFDIHSNEVEERLKFWKELNDYAVYHRGISALKEFKVE